MILQKTGTDMTSLAVQVGDKDLSMTSQLPPCILRIANSWSETKNIALLTKNINYQKENQVVLKSIECFLQSWAISTALPSFVENVKTCMLAHDINPFQPEFRRKDFMILFKDEKLPDHCTSK